MIVAYGLMISYIVSVVGMAVDIKNINNICFLNIYIEVYL